MLQDPSRQRSGSDSTEQSLFCVHPPVVELVDEVDEVEDVEDVEDVVEVLLEEDVVELVSWHVPVTIIDPPTHLGELF